MSKIIQVLNSYVCRIRQSIPYWRILCSKKAVHLLQCRCHRIPQASLVSTLVPYLSWGRILVCRLYFMLFLSTNKLVAGQIKTSYYPPPPLPPHRTKYSSLYVCRIYRFLMRDLYRVLTYVCRIY